MTRLLCAARPRQLASTRIALLLLALAPSYTSGGMLREVETPLEEPFDSFRALDSNLSLLQKQFTEVRRGLQMGLPAETKQWADAVHATARTASSIETIARKLKVHYLHSRQTYGAKVFRQLESRASSSQRQIMRLETSPGAGKAKAADAVSASILKLIEQYQAVSAGYEKSHCTRRKWPCCLPKRSATGASSTPGCKWECVGKQATCKKGFLGTRLLRHTR